MDETLLLFIQQNFPEARILDYIETYELMRQLEVAEFEDELVNMLGIVEMYDVQDFLDLFHSKIVTYLRQVIGMHEIRVDDTAPIRTLIHVLDTIIRIQDWIDHDWVVTVTESALDDEEKFCEMAFTITGENPHGLIVHLEEVSPAFISKLQELHSPMSQTEIATHEDNPDLIEQLRLVKEFVNYDDALGFKMLKIGIRVGAELSVYTNLIHKHFDNKTEEEISREIFVLLFMASDTYKDIMNALGSLLHLVFDDLNKITRIDTNVKNKLIAFEAFKVKKKHNTEVNNEQK